MRICLITDEISGDPETAFELGVGWGVHDFEIRGYGFNRFPLFHPYQKQRLKELLDEFSVRIVAVSPGLFKIPYPLGSRPKFSLQTFDFNLHQQWQNAHDLVKYHLEELLPLSLEHAKDIGAKIVIIFSFERVGQSPGRAPDEVLDVLSQAARRAEKEGISLAIEVEDGFWADTGARTAEIIEAIDQPSLGVNWDPANAAAAGDHPFPDGYRAVNQFVRHVHFKDLQRSLQGNVEYTIQGEIDWKGQIEALKNDGYRGYVSVETHMQPKVACARMMVERLQALLKASEKKE